MEGAQHSRHMNFTLTGLKESTERKVKIDDFDPSVVEAMLQFMYTFDYNNPYSASSMIFDAQVYQIADKYDIAALQRHSKDKFNAAIATGWALDDFPLAINVVYESTPLQNRGLRDLAVEISYKHINKLIGNDGFQELLRNTPDFSADLIPFLCGGQTLAVLQRYKCPNCNGAFSAELEAYGTRYYCPLCGGCNSSWNRYLCKKI